MDEYENIVARFFIPREGDRIALLIAAFLVIFLIFTLLGCYLLFHLPHNFPLSLFILLLVFLAGISLVAVVQLIDRAKIGGWLLLTERDIRLGKKAMPWENVQQIIYYPKPTSDIFGYTSRYLPGGLYLFAIPPLEFRDKIKKLTGRLYRLFSLIRSNSFHIPFEVEELPELLNNIFRFVRPVVFDIETFLISQLTSEESIISSPLELFQAKIYERKNSIPSLYNFYQGIRHLLKLSLPMAERHLSKAYEEGESRARPYLALSLFLQQKYEQCISLFKKSPQPLNRGEKLIQLTSLANLGKWKEIEEAIPEHPDIYEKFFQLGALCFLGEWDELLLEGENIRVRNIKPALEVCLECARRLRLERIAKPPQAEARSKSTLRYYLSLFLAIFLSTAGSFLKGWLRGIGYFLAFIIFMLIHWFSGKFVEKEAYVQWAYYLQRKFASPFWCPLLYLYETIREKK